VYNDSSPSDLLPPFFPMDLDFEADETNELEHVERDRAQIMEVFCLFF